MPTDKHAIEPRIIVVFDYPELSPALQLLEQLNPKKVRIKIGSAMFTKFGPQFVETVVTKGFDVFLDLKFFDIPNTVAVACKAACELGVWMLNVHALGGKRMMEGAREVVDKYSGRKPLLIAVTLLTSVQEQDVVDIGLTQEIPQHVVNLAKLAKSCELDGVVCSAHEAPQLRQQIGDEFLLVTPGIRLAANDHQDQRRVVTPQQAIELGSDYLVIGRAITQAADPIKVLEEIEASM